ncbi:MAG: XDD4 family exosortase-dependent surface protein [Phycisphaerae bacterium]
MRGTYVRMVLGAALLLAPATSVLGDITFNWNDGEPDGLAASASFSVNGDGDLVVTLANTSTGQALVPTDVLTAVFFDLAGVVDPLSADSAILGGWAQIAQELSKSPPNYVWLPYQAPGTPVGGEYGYMTSEEAPDPGQWPARHVISAVGLDDLVGPKDVFDDGDTFEPGANHWGPDSPNGIDYGLVGSNDGAQGNGGLLGTPLVQSSVILTLGGLPGGFTADSSTISNVVFNYGTEFAPIPAPAAVVLGLIGLGILGCRMRQYA